jgi:hypothetical protein
MLNYKKLKRLLEKHANSATAKAPEPEPVEAIQPEQVQPEPVEAVQPVPALTDLDINSIDGPVITIDEILPVVKSRNPLEILDGTFDLLTIIKDNIKRQYDTWQIVFITHYEEDIYQVFQGFQGHKPSDIVRITDSDFEKPILCTCIEKSFITEYMEKTKSSTFYGTIRLNKDMICTNIMYEDTADYWAQVSLAIMNSYGINPDTKKPNNIRGIIPSIDPAFIKFLSDKELIRYYKNISDIRPDKRLPDYVSLYSFYKFIEYEEYGLMDLFKNFSLINSKIHRRIPVSFVYKFLNYMFEKNKRTFYGLVKSCYDYMYDEIEHEDIEKNPYNDLEMRLSRLNPYYGIEFKYYTKKEIACLLVKIDYRVYLSLINPKQTYIDAELVEANPAVLHYYHHRDTLPEDVVCATRRAINRNKNLINSIPKKFKELYL